MERESMEFDVVIIGAGPAGLSTAIRLAQLSQQKSQPLNICILEKGASVGAHIMSGAVIETRALETLIPDWQKKSTCLFTPATQDDFYYLTANKARRLPKLSALSNKGNYIISLSRFCQWLAQEAENLGVSIFPGFPARKILMDKGKVIGVQTNDMGLDKMGNPTPRFQAGINLYAKQTVLAEGCRGSLSEWIIRKFNLRAKADPQTYAIGIKELWKVDHHKLQKGKVMHTVGWPLDKKTYGGSFLYHFDDNLVSIGFVVGLDYQNPYLDPFKEFQRFKTHPIIKPLLTEGECVGYGSRALNEGGWQSIPKLTFPGGVLIGCAAGFLNVAKIKGTHTAMQSGLLAAEAILDHLHNNKNEEAHQYQKNMQNSWVSKELYCVRNIRPAFQKGLWCGLIYSGIDQFILRGKAPWTFHHHADYSALKPASQFTPINYAKPDGKITFDKLSQVYLTATQHRENEPCHLTLKNDQVPISINLAKYDAPEQRYCPAAVYEIVSHKNKPALHINAANCIHCKTCDIKDPTQNIVWVTPEGGDGPHYNNL